LKPIFRVTWNSSSLPSAILPLCEIDFKPIHVLDAARRFVDRDFHSLRETNGRGPNEFDHSIRSRHDVLLISASLYRRVGAGFQCDTVGPGASRGVNLPTEKVAGEMDGPTATIFLA
jgi:hypothetical protein